MSRLLADLDLVTREKARRLITASTAVGMELFVVHTHRTYAEQDALFEQGRSEPGRIVTNARGGESWHNFRRAIDVAFEDHMGDPKWDDLTDDEIDDWELLGLMGKKIGLVWGGDWAIGDYGHFHYQAPGETLGSVRAAWEAQHGEL